MIDIGQEELIAIRDVPGELPRRPNGRHGSQQTFSPLRLFRPQHWVRRCVS